MFDILSAIILIWAAFLLMCCTFMLLAIGWKLWRRL